MKVRDNMDRLDNQRSYNGYMGGVVKADMVCGIDGVNRKSKKWWHKMFF